MADKFEPFAREETKTRPDNDKVLWCPFCNEWRLTDSMVARKKLGMHITNMHPGEVRFKQGVAPPEIDSEFAGRKEHD